MLGWSAANLRDFLLSRDLVGLANICHANGVNGKDLHDLDSESAVNDLRLTPFQAKKLLASREAFLQGVAGDGRHGR